MKRSTALAFVLVAALVGCSRGSNASTLPTAEALVPELPLVSLVDPNSPAVVHVDLARISGTSAYATASGWTEGLGARVEGNADLSFALGLLDAREIIFFINGGGGEPMATLIVRGSFDESSLDRFTSEQSASAPTYRHGPFTVHRVGSDGAATRLGNHTLVVGQQSAVDAVLDRQIAGGSGHYPEAEAFRALAERVGLATNPIGIVVVPTAAMRASAQTQNDALSSAMAAARGVGLGVDIGSGLRATAVVELGSSLEAAGAATLARMQLGRIAQDETVRELGLAPLIPHLAIEREGAKLIGVIDAPESAVDESMRTLDAYVRGQLAAQ